MTARLSSARKWGQKNLLLIFTMIGVVLGISLGFVLRLYDVSVRTLTFVTFPGTLFMRALYLVIGPLILTSVICGISGVKSGNLRRAGLQIVAFYWVTTAFASVLGICLAIAIRPGGNVDGSDGMTQNIANDVSTENYSDIGDVVLDLIRNLIPDNVVRAMFQTETTKYRWKESLNRSSPDGIFWTDGSLGNGSHDLQTIVSDRYSSYSDSVNFIGIIAFGLFFGAALRQIGDKGKILEVGLNGLNNVFMQMVLYVMWYSPIGVLFLIAGNIAVVRDDLAYAFQRVAKLCGTYLLGLFVHMIVINVIYLTLTRKNPFRLLVGMKDSLMVAWATASSCAALPTTIRCLEKNCGVRSEICQLVLPIGATINMDAGALHSSLVVIYVAQLHNISLSFGRLLQIAFYSAFTSIGAAAIPNSFFAIIYLLLRFVNLPTQDIGLLFAVEWLMDRFKTCVNMYGDCVGASIVNHWQKTQDEKISEERSESLIHEVEIDREDCITSV